MSSNCHGQFYDGMLNARWLVGELRTEITFLSYSNICSLYGSYIKRNIQCVNDENVSSAESYGSFADYCICEKFSEKTCCIWQPSRKHWYSWIIWEPSRQHCYGWCEEEQHHRLHIQPFCHTRWCIAIKSIEANYTNPLILVTLSINRGQCRRTKSQWVHESRMQKSESQLLKSVVLLLADRVEQINYYCSLKCILLGEKRSNKVLFSNFYEESLLCQDISRHVCNYRSKNVKYKLQFILEFVKLQGVYYVVLWIEILHLPEHPMASAMPTDTIKRTPVIRTILNIRVLFCTAKGSPPQCWAWKTHLCLILIQWKWDRDRDRDRDREQKLNTAFTTVEETEIHQTKGSDLQIKRKNWN